MDTVNFENKYEYDRFFDYVMEHLFDGRPDLAEGAQMKLSNVKKNNGVVLRGLTILQEGENIGPTLYLQDLYKEHREGKNINACVAEVREMYFASRADQKIDISFFEHFDLVKDKIQARVINTEMNRHMLDEMPHFEFGDLSIAFYVEVNIPEVHMHGSIRVLNEHLAMWEVTPKEVLDIVMANAKEKEQYEVMPMEVVLGKIFGEEISDLFMDQAIGATGMYVMSNANRMYGAAGILYPELLEEHAEKINDNFYILPSSLHEVIMVNGNGLYAKELREMVGDVNTENLEEEEILSYNVYFYDKESKELYRTDTGEVMHLVDNTPSIKICLKPEDLKLPKKESIKEKMEGYKAVVKNSEPSSKKTAPDYKKDSVRE